MNRLLLCADARRRRRAGSIGGLLLVLIWLPATLAAELNFVNVSHQKKRFFVKSSALLDAPIRAVYDTLVDFDNYEKFSSVYDDARWLQRNDDGSGEIYTYTRGCIAFFCKGFARVETVVVTPYTDIETRVDPKRSDASHGVAIWKLTEINGKTEVRFDLELEPSFWVPPLIGPYLVKRRLKSGGEDALERIEVLAQQRLATATPGRQARMENTALPVTGGDHARAEASGTAAGTTASGDP